MRDATADRYVTAVDGYWQAHGYGPSIRDLAECLGVKSPGSVHLTVRKLIESGRLTHEPGRPRTIRVPRRRRR